MGQTFTDKNCDLPVAQAVTAFAVHLPFDQISPLMNTLVDLPLDGDTIRRVAERVGGVAEAAIAAVTAAMAAEGEAGATETSAVGRASDAEAELNGGVAPDALIVSVDAATRFVEGSNWPARRPNSAGGDTHCVPQWAIGMRSHPLRSERSERNGTEMIPATPRCACHVSHNVSYSTTVGKD